MEAPSFLYLLAQAYYAKTDEYDRERFGVDRHGELNWIEPYSQPWRESNRFALRLLMELQARARMMGHTAVELGREMGRYDQRNRP